MRALRIIVITAIFIISILLIVMGQRDIGPTGLMSMLVGIVGLLWLLYRYNKIYK